MDGGLWAGRSRDFGKSLYDLHFPLPTSRGRSNYSRQGLVFVRYHSLLATEYRDISQTSIASHRITGFVSPASKYRTKTTSTDSKVNNNRFLLESSSIGDTGLLCPENKVSWKKISQWTVITAKIDHCFRGPGHVRTHGRGKCDRPRIHA